jgi:hypothetical protein
MNVMARDPLNFDKAEPAIGTVGRSGKRFCVDFPASVASFFLEGQRFVPVLFNLGPGIIDRASLVPLRGGGRRIYVSKTILNIFDLGEGDIVPVQLIIDQETVDRKSKPK